MLSTVDRSLERGHRAYDRVNAEKVATFFADKVKRFQSSTTGSSPPTFRPAPPGFSTVNFQPLSTEDVAAAIARLPDKPSAVDPIPRTSLILTPLLTQVFGSSMAIPVSIELDETSLSSCRPISNLTVICKLFNVSLLSSASRTLESDHLLPTTQCGYRRGHSTETMTIRALSGLLDVVD